jgi:hypothetical protein
MARIRGSLSRIPRRVVPKGERASNQTTANASTPTASTYQYR